MTENKFFEGKVFTDLSLSDKKIEGCGFLDCEFRGCTFERCETLRCEFSECLFVDCVVREFKCEKTEMRFAAFERCRLSGIRWRMLTSSGRIGNVIRKIKNSELKYNIFSEMSLVKLDFSDTSVTESSFAECNLTESDFRRCNLTGTEFYKCDLRKSDFRQAKGYRIDIGTCKMKAARFSYPEVTDLLNQLEIKIE